MGFPHLGLSGRASESTRAVRECWSEPADGTRDSSPWGLLPPKKLSDPKSCAGKELVALLQAGYALPKPSLEARGLHLVGLKPLLQPIPHPAL